MTAKLIRRLKSEMENGRDQERERKRGENFEKEQIRAE